MGIAEKQYIHRWRKRRLNNDNVLRHHSYKNITRKNKTTLSILSCPEYIFALKEQTIMVSAGLFLQMPDLCQSKRP